MKRYLREITDHYLSCGRPYPLRREEYLRDRYYNTAYRVYDIRKKNLLEKMHYSFSTCEPQEQAAIWSFVFKNTPYLGIGSMAINHFKKKTAPLISFWPLLKSWAPHVENWVHGDMVCSLYCGLLTENPERIYGELKKWSTQRSPWKNRLAIVSLLYYYHPKRVLLPFQDIVALIHPHLSSDHHYLQKAIGWCLRELSRAYPKEQEIFMRRHLLQLSPTAFTTAVEKMPGEVVAAFKAKRKESRQRV